MRRVGTIDYPNTFETIIADAEFNKVWVAYCKKSLVYENHAFLMDIRKPFSAPQLAQTYFNNAGSRALNLTGKALAWAHDLAEDRDWNSPLWDDIFAEAARQARAHLRELLSGPFWQHHIFKDHHKANGGGPRDRATEIEDTPPPKKTQIASLLGGVPSPALDKALAQFAKEGESLRALTLFQRYLKDQKSALTAQAAIKILIANHQISTPKAGNAVAAANKLSVQNIRAVEAFLKSYDRIKSDGVALWDALVALKEQTKTSAPPRAILTNLVKSGVIAPGATPIDPTEEDMPPPPPPEDEDAGVARATAAGDKEKLPTVIWIHDLGGYPKHVAAVDGFRRQKNKAKLAGALKLLKTAMVKKDDCHPDVTLRELADEVLAFVARNGPPVIVAEDPFPEPRRKAPSAPKPDPFPDDDRVTGGVDFGDMRPGAETQAADPRKQRQVKLFVMHQINAMAEALTKGDTSFAKSEAVKTAKQLAQENDQKFAMSAKQLLQAAQRKAGPVKRAKSDQGEEVELSLSHASKADWPTFGKVYHLEDEELALCRDIAVSTIKSGTDSSKAVSSARDLVAKQKKKKSKFGFKNAKHAIAAVSQLMKFKATSKKLTKPMKPSDADDVA